MRTRIVGFGKGAWYPRGIQRLKNSLSGYYDGEVAFYSDEAQLGCLPHRQAPYAFKVAAIRRAQQDGVDVVLWLDASVWAVRPLAPLVAHIAEHGHALFNGGWNCGQWTNDAMLHHFGVDRESAKAMPMYLACYMGFDLRNPRTREWLDRWEAALPYFPGHWTNDRRTESQDPYCQGHRHDQSAGSLAAALLGMDLTLGHETFAAYYHGDDAQIKPTVCLLAQGM